MVRYGNLIEALEAAPGERPFVTAWVNEDEQETVTFAEFRRRARLQAGVLRANSVTGGDRVIIIMPQGILTMTVFIGAMMLDAVPALIAYPNDKVEPSKYRFGVAGRRGCFELATAAASGGRKNSRLPRVNAMAWRSSSIRRAQPDCRRGWR